MTFRWLLSIASWLDQRFPPKVTVTDEIFAGLQEKEHRHSKEIAKLQGDLLVVRERLEFAEKSIAAIKEAIMKGGTAGITESERRARFISEGRLPPVPAEAT